MGDSDSTSTGDGTLGSIVVRYWAGAKAAAGVEQDTVEVDGGATLGELLETVRLRHVDRPRFKDVVSVCSVLVGDRPIGTTDPELVVLRPGDTVELLPPFAGG